MKSTHKAGGDRIKGASCVLCVEHKWVFTIRLQTDSPANQREEGGFDAVNKPEEAEVKFSKEKVGKRLEQWTMLPPQDQVL